MSHPGFYSSGSSPLHRAHPAVKIVAFCVLIPILPFVLVHVETQIALVLVLLLVLASVRPSWQRLVYFMPALGIIFVAGLTWLITDIGGRTVFHIDLGPLGFDVRDRSISRAATASLDAMIWILSYMTLLLTTASRDIVAGLRSMGVADRVARTIAMTLRFWASILSDARHVADAQTLRGMDVSKSALSVFRRVVAVTIPMVFLMLKRFQTLAFALHLRDTGSAIRSTRLYHPPLRMRDWGLALLLAVVVGMLAAFDRGLIR